MAESRCERAIDYDWGSGGPDVEGVGVNNFAARWVRALSVPDGANYALRVRVDDGVRIFFNGELVLNEWGPQGPTEHCERTGPLEGGTYEIVVEYREIIGMAVIELQEPFDQLPCGLDGVSRRDR